MREEHWGRFLAQEEPWSGRRERACLAREAREVPDDQVIEPRLTDENLTNSPMGFICSDGAAHPDVADVYRPSVTWGDVEPAK